MLYLLQWQLGKVLVVWHVHAWFYTLRTVSQAKCDVFKQARMLLIISL